MRKILDERVYIYIDDDSGRHSGGGGGGGGRLSGKKGISNTSEHVQRRLYKLIQQRIKQSPLSAEVQTLRFPVGIFFARSRDVSGASDIRAEIASSFEFWSKDSGEHFDMFFPGWYFHKNKLSFNTNRFMEYRQEIERNSKWRYSGETDLLILNFEYDTQSRKAQFAFDEVIILQVEAMIREKQIGSLSALLSLIHNAAKSSRGRGEQSVVWEMSDRLGFLRGRQSLWEALKKFILKDFAQVYNNVRPFGVFDLRVRTGDS